MTENHPISPPAELVQAIWDRMRSSDLSPSDSWAAALAEAAEWGADQELEACCEWFQEFYKTESWVKHDLKHFRAARRPKPPSEKEQTLLDLDWIQDNQSTTAYDGRFDRIRRALEALPND